MNSDLLFRLFAEVATPFNDNGVDEKCFGEHCARVLRSGAEGLLLGGTSGEGSTLLPVEHERLLDISVEVAGRRAPVIFAIESNCTAQAVERARTAERRGATALLAVVPFYNKPREAGLEAHFLAIAAATRLPLIVLDAPSRTGLSISSATVDRLAASNAIVGLADASSDITRSWRYLPQDGRRVTYVCANDAVASAYLGIGGKAWFSASANLVTSICANLVQARRDANQSTAIIFQEALAPIHEALSLEPGPAALKYAMAVLGFMDARVRLPLVPPSRAVCRRIEAALG